MWVLDCSTLNFLRRIVWLKENGASDYDQYDQAANDQEERENTAVVECFGVVFEIDTKPGTDSQGNRRQQEVGEEPFYRSAANGSIQIFEVARLLKYTRDAYLH